MRWSSLYKLDSVIAPLPHSQSLICPDLSTDMNCWKKGPLTLRALHYFAGSSLLALEG